MNTLGPKVTGFAGPLTQIKAAVQQPGTARGDAHQ